MCSPTEHLLDFNHSRNLSWLSSTASIASDDSELVLSALGHVCEGVLAHLGGCSITQGPLHLIHLLHLDQVTSDDRATFLLRRQPGQRHRSPGAVCDFGLNWRTWRLCSTTQRGIL